MRIPMDAFIASQNLNRFLAALRSTTDRQQLELLLTLTQSEQLKLPATPVSLAHAERLIALGAEMIAGERSLLATLRQDGKDTAIAEARLQAFLDLQEINLSHRDRLWTCLSNDGNPMSADLHSVVRNGRVR